MFWLERRVVAALAGADDERTGGGVTEFVETTLADMPEYQRFGVAVESVVLGAWTRLRYGRAPDADAVHRALASFERVPVNVVRLYPRLFSSLVLFARYELPDA
ncbi:MAG: hypothetical protein ACXVJ7_14825 [Acidimicrobiia bacterium]